MYKLKRGVKIMKYKVLDSEYYAEKLGFSFHIEKCEDESGNILYRLVARAVRGQEEICLFENYVFITYTQVIEAATDFLLSRIVEHLRIQVDFYNLENIEIKQLYDGIKINDKVFEIANDFDALYENTTNYISDIWEIKEYGGVLKF